MISWWAIVSLRIILNPFCDFLVRAFASYFLAEAVLHSLINLVGAMRASNAKSILRYLSYSFSKNLKLENINIYNIRFIQWQPHTYSNANRDHNACHFCA